jgi:hypothetical protein
VLRHAGAGLLLALTLVLAAPGPADAHLKTGLVASDFQARAGSFRPAAPGLAARVLGGDQRLELRVAGGHVVIVLGLLGEPFLRFSPAGVEANLASPTASGAKVIKAGNAVSTPGVTWRRVSRGHALAWHENRLRPEQNVSDPSAQARKVATWSIPLLVAGRRTSLVGSEWYASGPSLWPWLGAGALLLGSAGLAARLATARVRWLIAATLLPLAIGALLAAWCGTFLADRGSGLAELFAIVFAAVTALVLLTAVAAARGPAQVGVMALAGAFTAACAVPQLAVFGHGFVLSALSATAARLMVAGALIGGIAVAAVCAPGVTALLGDPSSARRSPGG